MKLVGLISSWRVSPRSPRVRARALVIFEFTSSLRRAARSSRSALVIASSPWRSRCADTFMLELLVAAVAFAADRAGRFADRTLDGRLQRRHEVDDVRLRSLFGAVDDGVALRAFLR